MKKLFFSGLTLLLPFAITLFIAIYLVELVTNPFHESVYHFLNQYESFRQPLLFFSSAQTLSLISTLVILAVLIFLCLLIGFIGHLFYEHTLFLLGDRLMRRIPYIRKVYKATHEGVNTFLHSKNNLFSQVVLVPFPGKQGLGIGLIQKPSAEDKSSQKVLVFIPGAPNATFALMLYYKLEELIPLNLTVEEAFKWIISCGTAFPAGLTLEKGSLSMTTHHPEYIFLTIKDNAAKLQAICDTVQRHFYKAEKMLILVSSDEAAHYIDQLLWKYSEESFIPHAIISSTSHERVAISKVRANLNQAAVLFNLRPEAATQISGPHTLIYDLLDETTPVRASALPRATKSIW